jgi:signal peptidase I
MVKLRVKSEALKLALLIGLILVARSTLADHYLVPTGSMEYTLMPGDRVLVDKRAYGLRIPFSDVDIAADRPVRRGEIVVFDSPRDGQRLIKRIVAVAGDEVRLDRGRLFIDGLPLATGQRATERFHGRDANLNLEHGGGSDIAGLVIPPGMVLAIGDHRGNSLDSRVFGLVPETKIYGRALGVYYRASEGLTWRSL